SGLGGRGDGGLGEYVEAVHLQPARAAGYLFGIDIVGDADEVEHGGEAQLVAAGAEERAADHAEVSGRAAVNVCNFKFRSGFGGLAECRDGEESHQGRVDTDSHIFPDVVARRRLAFDAGKGRAVPRGEFERGETVTQHKPCNRVIVYKIESTR